MHFGLNLLEKMFLGYWGARAVRAIVDERVAPRERAPDLAGLSVADARAIVDRVILHPECRAMVETLGAKRAIEVIVRMDAEDYRATFGVPKPRSREDAR